MALASIIEQARVNGDPSLIVEAIPFAQALGLEVSVMEGEEAGELRFKLPPRASNVGNASLPAIHGGALGGFMEAAGLLHLMMTMRVAKIPKIVDFSIDYIRAGLLVETWCSCVVIREGRKMANLHIEAWQSDRNTPIARARANVLMDE